MLRDLSPKKALWLSMAVVVLLLTFTGIKQLPNLLAADMPNPDSYTKLVLVRDWQPETGYQYMARDGAPDGSYLHWSVVHTWTLQKMAMGLRAAGMTWESALLLAGGSLTAISLFLLYLFTCLAIIAQGGRLAVLGTALVLATGTGLNAYGKWVQVTHHIFMLAPIAAAAWLIFKYLRQTSSKPPEAPLPGSGKTAFFIAGALLALSLWVSPETMPLIAAIAAIAAANRLQFSKQTTPVWPLACGLFAMLMAAWLIDPPPPTFSAWALDHISLAWLGWGGILAVLLVLTDFIVTKEALSFNKKLLIIVFASLCGVGAWLWFTPGVLAGPAGLLPEELKTLWWVKINELRPLSTPAELLLWVGMPALAGVLLLYQAWRQRCLWWAILAATALAYSLLTSNHVRMGAAAVLAGALAWGVWLAQKPAFSQAKLQSQPASVQLRAAFWLLLPITVLMAALLLGEPETSSKANEATNASGSCSIKSISTELAALPPATIASWLNEAPRLLWFTPHRVVAGNYHHNTEGMLDILLLLEEQAPDTRAQQIAARRQLNYLLICGSDADNKNQTLHARAKRGEAIPWLQGPQNLQGWNLYSIAPVQ